MNTADLEVPLSLPQSIFRAYDIRGIVGETISEEVFYWVGLAVGTRLQQLQRTQVYVGRDVRRSSLPLSQALIKGLTQTGLEVLVLGEVSTPMTYFATQTTPVDSGLMVTGSHNPAHYNGIKMVLAGKTLVEKEIAELHACIKAKDFFIAETVGQVLEHDIFPSYEASIVKNIQCKKSLKVVVDAGNGAAGPVAPPVLQKLGFEVIPLYCDVNGDFPHHHPDPTVQDNLQDLIQAVLFHQADIGLAFDGDADRLGVITPQGEIIWPDRLMVCLAQAVLQEVPGASIVYDVKCTKQLAESIQAAGGKPIMSPTGHSLVKSLMIDTGALLAGEMSGHIFYRHRWFGFDDALYSACRLLEILSAFPGDLDTLFQTIPNMINTPELKIPMNEDQKFEFMNRFVKHADFEEGTPIDIDGLRVEFKEGWGLLRASNTSPCLVARFEATSEDALKQIQQRFKTQIHRISPDLVLPF